MLSRRHFLKTSSLLATSSVIPGFVEGHMHLFAGAAELSHLDLFGTREQILNRHAQLRALERQYNLVTGINLGQSQDTTIKCLAQIPDVACIT